ncbi:MAG: UvrD-helicase domain-containing protein [Fibrobacteria bacterium]
MAVPTADLFVDPFAHPDAQRRFRVLRNVEELEAAFANPWEKWILFLHPSQKELVGKEFTGPARVSGSAGTGKTIVALHRAVALARRHQDARVLLTTFSETLANALRSRLLRLLGSEPKLGERLEVHDLNAIGRRLFELNVDRTPVADAKTVSKALRDASEQVLGHKFSEHFLRTEWDQVVDAWQVDSWEANRDVKRLGRKTRLPEKQRVVLWSIFERVRQDLKIKKRVTYPEMFTRLSEKLSAGGKPPFDFAVVDESQDIQVAQLRYLAALGNGRPNSLFFAGDLGQRIFKLPFSWKGPLLKANGIPVEFDSTAGNGHTADLCGRSGVAILKFHSDAFAAAQVSLGRGPGNRFEVWSDYARIAPLRGFAVPEWWHPLYGKVAIHSATGRRLGSAGIEGVTVLDGLSLCTRFGNGALPIKPIRKGD